MHLVPRLAALTKLTRLRFLDIDGGTELTPSDLELIAGLSALEVLIVRNSSLLHGCNLTSLSPLSRLEKLDFSLHGDYIELADDDGEADQALPVGSEAFLFASFSVNMVADRRKVVDRGYHLLVDDKP